MGAWMAAYALRELLEELEAAAHVGAKGPRLGEQVAELANVWRPTRDQDGILHAEPAMLEAVDQLLKRRAEDAPQRRARAALLIKGLDPVGLPGPPVLREKRTEALMDFRAECNLLLHQRPDEADQRLESLLESFEPFVLGWLRPQPSVDLPELDRVLELGPPDA
jgi:hypothetical protein